MADHVQQQVLDAVKAALIAAATDAGTRVYLDRVDEILQTNLPAIDILGDGFDDDAETIERLSISFPYLQKHTYGFGIGAIATTAAAARNLGKQVAAALLASRSAITVDSTAIDMAQTGSGMSRESGAAVPLFRAQQAWQAIYHTQAGTPDAVF